MSDLFERFGIDPRAPAEPTDLFKKFNIEPPGVVSRTAGKLKEEMRPELGLKDRLSLGVERLAEEKQDWADIIASMPNSIVGQLKQFLGGSIQRQTDTGLVPGAEPAAEALAAERLGVPARMTGVTKDPEVAAAGARLAAAGKEQQDEATKELRERFEDATPIVSIDWWKRVVMDQAPTLAVQVPALAASIFTKSLVPALGTAGVVTAGIEHAEQRAANIPPGEAELRSTGLGTTEAATELLPGKFLMDAVGGKVLPSIVKAFVADLGGEQVQTALEHVNAMYSTKPEIGWEEYGQAVLDTIGGTVVSMGVQSPIAAGLNVLANKEQATTPRAEPLVPSVTPTVEDDGVNVELPPILNSEANPTPSSSEVELSVVEASREREEDEDLAEAERILAEYEEKRVAPPKEGAEIRWAALSTAPTSKDDLGELGATLKQAKNADNYSNPNIGERMLRKFSMSTDVGAVGRTAQQVDPQPGNVYVLGEPTQDRNEEYLSAAMRLGKKWIDKYMPDSTLIISNEQLASNTALGWHHTVGNKQHLIVPAVLRKMKDPEHYNRNTMAGAFFNFAHEFSHALFVDRLMAGMPDALSARILAESRSGLISDEAIAKVPDKLAQGVFNAYNDLKSRILSDQMTASEFVKQWMGPAKLGRDILGELKVAPNDTARAVAKAIVRRANENKPQDLGLKGGNTLEFMESEFLGLEEFFAEQGARYAYAKKEDQGNPLAEYLKKGLDSLRQFFKDLKAEGIVAPRTEFRDWMDSLGQVKRQSREKEELYKARTQSGKRKEDSPVKGPKVELPPKAKTKKPPAVKLDKPAHTKATQGVKVDKVKKAKGMVSNLLRSGVIERQDNVYSELQGYIEREEWSDFIDVFQGLTGKTVKFEYDPNEGVRELYHWTDKVFDKFEKTEDLGFHFGSKEAAHARMQSKKKAETDPDFGNIRPSLVRIRNPVNLGEDPKWWDPFEILAKITDKGIFTKEEENRITKAMFQEEQIWAKELQQREEDTGVEASLEEWSGDAYRFTKPLRDALEAKGYDGLVYTNAVSRDKSYMAFRAEQINSKFEIVSQAPDWKDGKFDSPGFRAWFGDWKNTPEEASVVRVGVWDELNDGTLAVDRKAVSPPLVRYMSRERLERGERVFRASTVRGAHYGDALTETNTKELIPVVLNIRNPLVIAHPDEAVDLNQAELEKQGYDGIVYRDDWEGHMTFVAFRPDQVKAMLDRQPYARGEGTHLEFDHDQATPDGANAGRFISSVKNYTPHAGPLRKVVRAALSWAAKWAAQTQQIAHMNPGLVDYNYAASLMMEYTRDRSSLVDTSHKVVSAWQYRPQRQLDQISNVLLDEMASGMHWFEVARVPGGRKRPGWNMPLDWYEFHLREDTKPKLKERGIDVETEEGLELAQHILNIKNDIMSLILEARVRMFEIAVHRYRGNPQAIEAQHAIIRGHFKGILSKPFFPPPRNGKHVMVVRKKRVKGPGYEVVHQEHFNTEEAAKKAIDLAHSKLKADETLEYQELTDEKFVMMHFPKEFLKLAGEELGLSPKQVEALAEIMKAQKLENKFDPADARRLGLLGSSKDPLRVLGYNRDTLVSYANWTSHYSNLVSKTLYSRRINNAVLAFKDSIDAMARSTDVPPNIPEVRRLRRLHQNLAESVNYMMSPPSEWQMARAFVSTAYLWASPATAGINIIGLATNFTRLTTKYGTIKGTKQFLDAVWHAMQVTKFSLDDVRQNKDLDPRLMDGMNRAVKESVTSQSYVYHLAGIANAPALWRQRKIQFGTKWFQRVVDVGMAMFRGTEVMTRRVAFMALMKEGLNADMTPEAAYQHAVKELSLTQGDYTLANRIKLMRGERGLIGGALPLATVFMTFGQLVGFHATGGYELGMRRQFEKDIADGKIPMGAKPGSWATGYTARFWLLYLILAGQQGMPFGEDIMNVASWVWRKLGGLRPLRQEIRELVTEFTNPTVASYFERGLTQNVMGFDLSRKAGVGRLIPGLEPLDNVKPGNIEELVGTFALDLFGVSSGILKWGASIYDHGWEKGMLKAPGGFGNIYTAYYWSQNGVRGPEDAEITFDLKTGKLRPLTPVEIFGKAMGANPEVVARNREKYWGMYEIKVFWQSRRSDLLEKWDTANWQKDDDYKKSVKEEINKFNERLIKGGEEFRRLRISGSDLSDRERARRKRQARVERGQILDKRSRAAQESFRRSFGSPGDEASGR